MLALRNTSAARIGFQEPLVIFFVGGMVGGGFWNLLLQSFTYLYMLLQLSYNILQHGLFFLENRIQSNSLIQR